MMKILITGSKGQLGLALKNLEDEFPNYNFFFKSKDELDIVNIENIESCVLKNKIDIIINCAAYTVVNKANDEPEKANEINCEGVKNLALVAKKNNSKLIHLSTDYVFDGNSSIPYTELSKTNPQNAYGLSKLNGENAMLSVNPANSIIIRTAWLYFEKGTNFVNTIYNLSKEKEVITVVNDQIGSPTNASDLAYTILKLIPLIKSQGVKMYHYTNNGSCSWYEFAKEIVNIAKRNCRIEPITSEQLNATVKRPNYSLLDTEKIQNTFHIDIPNWKVALEKCMIKKMER